MKYKQKVDIVVAIFLILIGIVLLILPLFNLNNVKLIFITIMIIYSILNLIQFVLTIKDKDYEGLFTSLASIVVAIASFILDIEEKPVNLAVIIMIWVTLMSVIKLKKSDYYDDRNNKIWKLRIVSLVLFMIIGFLTSINLNFEDNVKIIILGDFFFIHGVLELTDPVVNYLLQRKK